jgi:hypothetical protein
MSLLLAGATPAFDPASGFPYQRTVDAAPRAPARATALALSACVFVSVVSTPVFDAATLPRAQAVEPVRPAQFRPSPGYFGPVLPQPGPNSLPLGPFFGTRLVPPPQPQTAGWFGPTVPQINPAFLQPPQAPAAQLAQVAPRQTAGAVLAPFQPPATVVAPLGQTSDPLRPRPQPQAAGQVAPQLSQPNPAAIWWAPVYPDSTRVVPLAVPRGQSVSPVTVPTAFSPGNGFPWPIDSRLPGRASPTPNIAGATFVQLVTAAAPVTQWAPVYPVAIGSKARTVASLTAGTRFVNFFPPSPPLAWAPSFPFKAYRQTHRHRGFQTPALDFYSLPRLVPPFLVAPVGSVTTVQPVIVVNTVTIAFSPPTEVLFVTTNTTDVTITDSRTSVVPTNGATSVTTTAGKSTVSVTNSVTSITVP